MTHPTCFPVCGRCDRCQRVKELLPFPSLFAAERQWWCAECMERDGFTFTTPCCPSLEFHMQDQTILGIPVSWAWVEGAM